MQIEISHITLPENFNKISDFYIPEDQPKFGIMYPGPIMVLQNIEYLDFINIVVNEAKKKNKLEFSLEFVHEKKRIILRGHSIQSIEGKVFIFRRLPSFIPKIEEIGMSKQILDLLVSERLNSGGLVVIAGETGQGKSTTAAATISYRLRKFGSFCLTIEDPIELPLQGFYENEIEDRRRGVCFQTSVDDTEIEAAIKSSMRCYPVASNSILFMGETRDALVASEVLKVAANGHLVITTFHGADLMTSLRRFISLATGHKGANEGEVKSMFASVFRLMIHQKMERGKDDKRRIKPTILFSPSASSSVASRLRTGNLEVLSTEIQNQNMLVARGMSVLENV